MTQNISKEALQSAILELIQSDYGFYIKLVEAIEKTRFPNNAVFNSSKSDKNVPQNIKPKFGSAKGNYKMSSDFDAPLEVFKDYM